MKMLLLSIGISIAGFAFVWWYAGTKPDEWKQIENPVKKSVKVYKGKWCKDFLEISGK